MYKEIDTGLKNKRGTSLIINRLYRFSWQKTLAHWYLKEIHGDQAIMQSKNGKIFRGNIDDLVYKNPKNTQFNS